MKKTLYLEIEKFFNALPASQDVTTCWKDAAAELPHHADIVVLMDDMFDTVGMASRLLYRMRENNIKVPLFYLLGGKNSLLGGNNALYLRNYAVQLGIKVQNIRMYHSAPDYKTKFEILNREAKDKTVVFVTSRLGYLPLRQYIDCFGCRFKVNYYVAEEHFEDALTWVNGNAASNGLALLHKIANLYSEKGVSPLLPDCLKSFKSLTCFAALRLIFSVAWHRQSINRESELMIRGYHRQFRKLNWAY